MKNASGPMDGVTRAGSGQRARVGLPVLWTLARFATIATIATIAMLATSSVAFAQAADLVRFKHLGVAACASSVCHGKIAPQIGRDVGLNEYRTWTEEDVHSRAYRVLEQPLSKRIAANSGLGDPTKEKLCLDCHADNVPTTRRGPKFQLADGVSCESCHGGSEKWIESHAALSRTHRENVSDGMYPSELPLQRAQLCLKCHLGSKDQFVTHIILAAGHPRLSFELDAYTTNQPAHFTADADYLQRKGKIEGMNLWLTGQLENARAMLQLQRTDLDHPSVMFPELALYDCHSCHHAMDQPRWTPRRAGEGIKPGTLRLQTQNLVVLQVVLGRLEQQAMEELATLTNALVKAGQRDVEATKEATGLLLEWLKGRDALSRRSFSRAEVLDVRKALVGYAASDKVGDYALAEQIVLGVESLSYALGDRSAKKAVLDRLYAAVKSATNFSPSQFSGIAKLWLDRF